MFSAKRIDKLLSISNSDIHQWFEKKYNKFGKTVYASVDIRDSGEKVVPIDTNLFPAGFNNLNSKEITRAAEQFKEYIQSEFPKVKNIAVIAESHTRNINYFYNLYSLTKIIKLASYEVQVINLELDKELNLENEYQIKLKISPGKIIDDCLVSPNGPRFDLILSNNDFSTGVPPLLKKLNQPIVPNIKAGWFKRKKSDHLKVYEELLEEFSNAFGLEKFYFSAAYSKCGQINFKEKRGLDCIANEVEKLLFKINRDYRKYSIMQKAYVYIKAERGTYGMGIMSVESSEEVYQMNKRIRNKMDVIKGGNKNTEVIIQEGISSVREVNEFPAEAMVYNINSMPISFIMRYNENKNKFANLNSPGLKFVNMDDTSPTNKNRQNIYEILAKLAVLAATIELYYSY